MGMRSGQLKEFLDAMTEATDWNILCLQEFGEFKESLLAQIRHRVYFTPKRPGIKPLGIVVNEKLVEFIDGDLCTEGRAAALNLNVKGLRMRIITAHLDPGRDKELYLESIEAVRILFRGCSETRSLPVLCVDGQDRLGPQESGRTAIGAFTEGPRSWKGESLLNLLDEMRVTAANTHFLTTEKATSNLCLLTLGRGTRLWKPEKPEGPVPSRSAGPGPPDPSHRLLWNPVGTPFRQA